MTQTVQQALAGVGDRPQESHRPAGDRPAAALGAWQGAFDGFFTE